MPDLMHRVIEVVGAHPAVREIASVGSRERGDATDWSDWDFKVRTDDFASLASALPSIVEPLHPLTAQWDPLSDEQCFMLIVDGPTKVDLIFDTPHTHEPPHVPSAETLAAIDAHFWDWTLWLTSKVAAGKGDVVRTELEKLTAHILRPMAIPDVPATLPEAVDMYLTAREAHEVRFGTQVPRELGRQVERLIREQAGVS